MTIAMQPIYTQIVGSGGVSSITFNNIPQTFTDLKVVTSLRGTASVSDVLVGYANGVTGTSYSQTILYGTGSGAASGRYSNNAAFIFGVIGGTNTTTNTFASVDIYIPNYTGSNFKSVISDSVEENNATAAFQYSVANLFRSTSAITSFTLYMNSGIFAQNSTFTLYGITKG